MNVPQHLKERILLDDDSKRIANGNFVLYWMCTAMRAHDNPALDVAIEMANNLQVPVLIYQGLSEKYPFASDRHHQFILEGVRSVQEECKKRGLTYVFHLERRQDRTPYLRILANMSSLIVTEYFPTPPLQKVIRKLKRTTDRPIWQVDSSCLIPMLYTRKEWTRAFHFRDYYAEEREERVYEQWIDATLEHCKIQVAMPLSGLDLSKENISDLIGQCNIDHTIPPTSMEGGSQAGYARFKKFKTKSLSRYHKDRNHPLRDGVSRLSAYLHYGMISVFKIAREVALCNGDGPKKYLDELLIWRELSYHWCHSVVSRGSKNLHSIQVLPSWAQNTLHEHCNDPHQIEKYEDLVNANTKDRFWNACQKSLIYHGELHNNIRMTWGKMLLLWTQNPQQCLRYLIDLNHRFALDGRDPASYGGLYWCMGLFDRPFKPEQLVTGTVRQRLSDLHANRLSTEDLERKVAPKERDVRIGIIGAGISGLVCATTLKKYGVNVDVFDKGRGVGGRTSTRISREDETWIFDHGAPYFIVDDKRMLYWTKQWENTGVLCKWNAKVIKIKQTSTTEKDRELWLAKPKMSSLAEHLASYLDPSNLYCNHKIDKMIWKNNSWYFFVGEKRFGPYDEIVSTIPRPQLEVLLPSQILGRDTEPINNHQSQWTVLLRCNRLHLNGDMYEFQDDVLKTAIFESKKNNHNHSVEGVDDWVLHAQIPWSQDNIELDKKTVAETVLASFSRLLQVHVLPIQTQVHRWRFAHVTSIHKPEEDRDYDYNSDFKLYLAGDAFSFFGKNDQIEHSSFRIRHTGIQRAVLSGQGTAAAILRNYPMP